MQTRMFLVKAPEVSIGRSDRLLQLHESPLEEAPWGSRRLKRSGPVCLSGGLKRRHFLAAQLVDRLVGHAYAANRLQYLCST